MLRLSSMENATLMADTDKPDKTQGSHAPGTEGLWQSVAAQLPDIIISVDANRTITAINHTVDGLKVGDVVGTSIDDHVQPEHAKVARECVARVLETGQPDTYQVCGTGAEGPESAWYETRVVPVIQNNEPVSVILVCRDITDLKLAQAALNDEQRLLLALMSTSSDHIYFKDKDSRFTRISDAQAKLFGLKSPDLAIGKTDHDFFAKEHADTARADEQAVMETGAPIVDKEEAETWPDGSTTWASTSKMPLVDADGQVIGTFGISRDITQRKQTEDELRDANMQLSDALIRLKRTQGQIIQHERLGALGRMASGIAHDFNNTLMPILGFSELLISDPSLLDDKEDALDMLRDIHTAAKDSQQAVARLREFYKPADETSYSTVYVDDMITKAISLTRPKWRDEAGSKGITVKVEADLQGAETVSGNESQLREVLINLILNAVDATLESGTITVRARRTDRDAIIEVIDNGEGMSEEVQQRCFEPFFSTKGASGTGMGLAVTHGIIRRHAGRIEIDSHMQKGTTVRLLFPVKLPSDDVPDDSAPPLPRTDVASIPAARILVIDDEPWSRKLVHRTLASGQLTIETAETGREGVEKFEHGEFDIVITDRAMPDVSGDQVAEIVKSARRNTPVILLTGFGQMMKDAGECPPGVDMILGKPVTEQELVQAVAKLLLGAPL